jgi:hypothetical protein
VGDYNQLSFIKSHRAKFNGPYLEVGSRYGLTQSIRRLFPQSEYLGLDLDSGPGVDVVIDMTQDFAQIDQALDGRRFNSIFCLSVLEHCRNPFLMCENITRLLNTKGVVSVSVPFSWKFHEYPSDYWRFTPEGVKVLFPDLVFECEHSRLSTSETGEIRKMERDLCRIRFSVSTSLQSKKYAAAATIAAMKLLGRLRIAPWLFSYPYLFPPVMINMIGEKK